MRTGSLILLSLMASVSPFSVNVVVAEPEPAIFSPEPADTTIVYDRAFIESIPNAISVIDIIRRIPGGNQLLPQGGGGGGGQSNRGFSNNSDSILIDGKRISGKENDSASALKRITLDQVLRIELIRGSSPDIKVSSQQAMLNIVLREDVSRSSGSWEVQSRSTNDGRTWFGGFLSYGGRKGNLEYFASLDIRPHQRTNKQTEHSYDENDNLLYRLNESVRHNRNEIKLSSNLIYTFGNDSELRLNGSFSENGPKQTQMGQYFTSFDGVLADDGTSFRYEDETQPNYELGGDYELRLNEKWNFKLLGLYTHSHEKERQYEDYLLATDEVEADFDSRSSELTSEAIARMSLTWNANASHELEFGTEMSRNRLKNGLDYAERIDGVMTPVVVDGSDTQVQEWRNESFLIHSWTIDEKLSLEGSLFSEFSKLKVVEDGVTNTRDFFFLRPSIDVRYNPNPKRQFQFSVRRRISQLDFGDFASVVSNDDEVVQGNSELRPEKTWEFETSVEQRFAGDDGSVKLRLFHEETSDKLQRVEVIAGVSGTGNFGHGTLSGAELSGSYRFGAIGLPDLMIEGSVLGKKTRLTDAFTGEKHQYNWRDNWEARGNVRHDFPSLGMSYGIDFRGEFGRKFYDIDEIITFSDNRIRLHAYVEKNMFDGVIFRVEGGNLNNAGWWDRERVFYDNGRTNATTGREVRRARAGQMLYLSVKGSF